MRSPPSLSGPKSVATGRPALGHFRRGDAVDVRGAGPRGRVRPGRGLGLLVVQRPCHRGSTVVGVRPTDGRTNGACCGCTRHSDRGGEVLAQILHPPLILAATESWPPNLVLARRNLAPFGGNVVAVEDYAELPFGDNTFDLIVSRHPTVTVWGEIARVLQPGGRYLSQQVGAGSVR